MRIDFGVMAGDDPADKPEAEEVIARAFEHSIASMVSNTLDPTHIEVNVTRITSHLWDDSIIPGEWEADTTPEAA